MATQEATPDSQSEESSALDLPPVDDIRDYVLQRPHQEADSEAFNSVETLSLPSSSDVDSEVLEERPFTETLVDEKAKAQQDTSHLNSERNDSWTSENFWLDPGVKGQTETKAEDDGLRKSLDRFYEMFGHPQPAARNPLSASICQCLSQKINELKGQENQKYALRSFQMAQVIFNRDGCSVLRRHSKDTHFYPRGEGGVSLDDEKPTPGLSKDIIRFLLQQKVMKDL
ncbi:shieldin complex subunit 1 isoform X1 [Mirounga leonina]|uniref:shieldin complex subunit 1 isoform X1 n=1 Tax=Mirounga leonina TaxID=9715 RepID=UPI00156C48BC|nr:shieldin complex subunit 1 isoform X1 [Mirounga leonina]XP_034861763.1 shieldin complex subunit 1 isoform X1 [Mirounga leonina]